MDVAYGSPDVDPALMAIPVTSSVSEIMKLSILETINVMSPFFDRIRGKSLHVAVTFDKPPFTLLEETIFI